MNKPEFQTTKIGDITIMSKPIPLPSLSPDGHAAWAGITEMLNADLQLRNSVMQDLFTKALRENAKPPIKGEITKGKLRYRGITLVIQPDGSRYLAQRGQRISDIILKNLHLPDWDWREASTALMKATHKPQEFRIIKM